MFFEIQKNKKSEIFIFYGGDVWLFLSGGVGVPKIEKKNIQLSIFFSIMYIYMYINIKWNYMKLYETTNGAI